MNACLINCHFGKLPIWTDFFIYSASKVKGINFFIFSDDEEGLMRLHKFVDDHDIHNVNLNYYTKENMQESIKSEFGVDFEFKDTRKICDLKTAYGTIFGYLTRSHDFWGHCDLDIIWGDINSYINPDTLHKYDIISGDQNRLCGPFTLYSNGLRDVYTKHPKWEKILFDEKHHAFDEVGLDQAIKLSKYEVLYGKDLDGRVMQNYGSPHTVPPLRIPATWNDGKLTIDADGRETMFIHMGHKACILDVDFKPSDIFWITERGLYSA